MAKNSDPVAAVALIPSSKSKMTDGWPVIIVPNEEIF